MMHNFWMLMRRYKALVFATLPFLISGVLWLLYEAEEGYGKIWIILLLIASMPIQAAMSVASVFYAFSKKDPDRRYREAAEVLSIISTIVFGGLVLSGIIGLLQHTIF